MLNNLSKQIYEANKLKGFDAQKENIGQTLMLIVSELSEALEADRKGSNADMIAFNKAVKELKEESSFGDVEFTTLFQKYIKDTFEDEISDSIIRLLDLVGAMKIDIEKHIELKRKYNSLRAFRHGKKY